MPRAARTRSLAGERARVLEQRRLPDARLAAQQHRAAAALARLGDEPLDPLAPRPCRPISTGQPTRQRPLARPERPRPRAAPAASSAAPAAARARPRATPPTSSVFEPGVIASSALALAAVVLGARAGVAAAQRRARGGRRDARAVRPRHLTPSAPALDRAEPHAAAGLLAPTGGRVGRSSLSEPRRARHRGSTVGLGSSRRGRRSSHRVQTGIAVEAVAFPGVVAALTPGRGDAHRDPRAGDIVAPPTRSGYERTAAPAGSSRRRLARRSSSTSVLADAPSG